MRKLLAIVALGVLATGCALPIGPPTAALTVIEKLRGDAVQPMQVGTFTPDSTLPSGADGSISLRADSISSPVKGSWSAYLGETVKVNVKAAGKLDEKSSLVLSGTLSDSEVGTGLPKGHAKLGAKFTVTKDGKTVFDRHVVVEDTWESSIIGVEAIPEASNRFVGLFTTLTAKLFDDPDFKAAVKP